MRRTRTTRPAGWLSLGEGDMAEISALDRGERTGPDPDRFNGCAPPATPRRRD
ncbi:hypothetical protein AB0D46_06135 [Streptomyces sp. NPDC048383]|uniref:hypothetical protein n=1 Tax=Streptomyces sp. NPDC048383 TaxID=3155386 RepID=UPI003429B3BF